MIALIWANALIFALFDYTDRDVKTSLNKTLYAVNIVFVVIYIIEMGLTIVAQGFESHPNAYIWNGWHIYDLFIVIVGFIELIPYMHRLRTLRVLRTLRILKLSYTTTSLDNLMTPWMRSFRHMCGILALLVFILLLFVMVGLYTFQGNLYYRCRMTPAPINETWPIDESITRFCSAYGYGDYDCPANRYCGTPDMYDLPLENENASSLAEAYYGTLSYDNAYVAFLQSFQVITFDSWADVMYKYQDANNTLLARFFFPLLVFIGAFFCLNLIIAVVFETFQNYRELLKSDAESAQEAAEPIKESPEKDRSDLYKQASDKSGLKDQNPEPSPQKPFSETVSAIGLNVAQDSEVTFTKLCKKLLANKYYKPCIVALVIGNLIVLSINRHNIEDSERKVLDAVNTVFFAVFIIEMIIQIGAVGLHDFLQSPTNIADVVINIVGVIEVGLTFSKYSYDYDVRTVIVIFRTLRTVKLVGKWDALRDTLNFLWSAKDDILNFAILLGIFIVVFAIIGMELFANEIKFNGDDQKDLINGERPRINFDTIGHALLSTFTLLIGDNWSTHYMTHIRFKPVIATLYFLTALIFLNILMLNLFLGILLQNFFSDAQKQGMEEEEKRNREFNEMQKKLGKPPNQYKDKVKTLLAALRVFKTILDHSEKCLAKKKTLKVEKSGGKSLFLFDEDSEFRTTVTDLVKEMWFQVLVYVMIAINSVVISFYTPLIDPDSNSYKAAFILDAITTAFFCLEVFLKSVAYGFLLNGPKSYLRNPFNAIDFLATVVAIISLSWDTNIIALKKIFLLIRILRTTRFLDMYEGFRMRIKALVKGFPEILKTLLITLMFIVVFAIIATQLFKGMYYYCDFSASESDESIVTVYDCLNLGADWRSYDISYDNILLSLMTLFELFTSKSWCNTITFASDFVDIDYVPKRDVSPHNIWFTVVYMIIAFLFLTAVLTGVISNTFCVHNERLQGLHKLTNAQRRWVSLSKVIFKVSPVKDYKSDCKYYNLYKFLVNRWVTGTLTGIILLNGIILLLSWYRDPDVLYTLWGNFLVSHITFK